MLRMICKYAFFFLLIAREMSHSKHEKQKQTVLFYCQSVPKVKQKCYQLFSFAKKVGIYRADENKRIEHLKSFVTFYYEDDDFLGGTSPFYFLFGGGGRGASPVFAPRRCRRRLSQRFVLRETISESSTFPSMHSKFYH